jgi:hypothetical protein
MTLTEARNGVAEVVLRAEVSDEEVIDAVLTFVRDADSSVARLDDVRDYVASTYGLSRYSAFRALLVADGAGGVDVNSATRTVRLRQGA